MTNAVCGGCGRHYDPEELAAKATDTTGRVPSVLYVSNQPLSPECEPFTAQITVCHTTCLSNALRAFAKVWDQAVRTADQETRKDLS